MVLLFGSFKSDNSHKKYLKSNRVGDHKWYVTNNSKFMKDYPKWKQIYNTKKIIEELISNI